MFVPIIYNILINYNKNIYYKILLIKFTSTVIKDTRVSITPCTWTIALQARSPSELNEYRHSNVWINNMMSCKDNMLQILSYT